MRTILAPIDFSPVSEAVVQLACEEARAWNAQLHLLYVSQRSEVQTVYENEERALTSLAEGCRSQGAEVESEVAHGDPTQRIRSVIDRLKPDLIVVGSHGHGAAYDLIVGSVAESLLRSAPCPVLVTPLRSHDR